jgi:heat shock protein HslJ
MRKETIPAYMLAAAILAASSLMLGGCGAEQASRPSGPVTSKISLLHTTWRVVEINGEKAAFLPGQKLDLSIVLAKGGQFSGSTGCNHLSGSYTLNADRLGFGSLLMTRIACSAQLMAREKAFLDAFRQVSSYAIRDGRLAFFNAGGRKVIELIALGKQ